MRPSARTSGGNRPPMGQVSVGLCHRFDLRACDPAPQQSRPPAPSPTGTPSSWNQGAQPRQRVGTPAASSPPAAQAALTCFWHVQPIPARRLPREVALGGVDLPVMFTVTHGDGSVAVSTAVCPCRCPPQSELANSECRVLPSKLSSPWLVAWDTALVLPPLAAHQETQSGRAPWPLRGDGPFDGGINRGFLRLWLQPCSKVAVFKERLVTPPVPCGQKHIILLLRVLASRELSCSACTRTCLSMWNKYGSLVS